MIGFLGTDKYDILLYLSKIFCRLNQKVLLVDYAENRALTYCIPVPKGELSEVGEKSKNDALVEKIHFCETEEKISYQGIDFMIEPLYAEILSLQENYDVILIDFGFQVYSKLISECSQIYLCMDQQCHHIMPLKPFGQFDLGTKEKCYLLVREVYNCKISAEYIMQELNLFIPEEKIVQYYQEQGDMKYCIDSQYNYTFRFMKLSKGMKSCILFLLKSILPEINERDMRYAYHLASLAKPTYDRS